ncbi:DUF4230 domain-containing protein [Novosphingobium sp. Gsoil 351]|uniref:DUF4230 domain-containing protein n=1 Tax=Novosphingobium sp. Gsoil 351 TaxID=2675225 RepID=UPI0012B4C348|nr:DUF4230 domain-containing protein [Novosphingobium sp. Gsoil 351]QGN55947.1 DUF4230 domain-containing protein [Novosphingobium sp. Gsoil 351]
MDDPKLATATLVPDARREQNVARVSALPWLLFLTALAVLAWHVFKPEKLGDPLATSLVAFEKQNRLTVFSAQLVPVVASDDVRYFGLVKSKQVAVIPARVDYTLDLSAMNRDRLAWNEAAKTLDVQLPALTLSRPNLDEARAQYLREGVFITREAQDKLNRNTTLLAEQQATNAAANPVLMGIARGAAKDAIRQNLAIPLQVAGFGDVQVRVRFDGEAAPK